VKFSTPSAEELSYLRPDPLLWEQELDARPDVAEAIERATGLRAGRVYWRSPHDHLYSLELADLGRGRPSAAAVYGHWDRYEPRPPEHEITADLLALSLWVAGIAASLNPADVAKVAQFAGVKPGWPEGSVLRTPEDRFTHLPGFPYEPRYAEVEGLRIAYVEHGEGDPILLLHREPTWSYLYRRMIPPLAAAGRVIAPDLVGFGRSDKPVAANAYTYKSHARWLRGFIQALDLDRITMVCQDWGGLLGLRVLSQIPDRFARLVAANTGLPDGSGRTEAFMKWRRFSQRVPSLDLARLMRGALKREISDAEAAAYAAPFPSAAYQTGARVFPRLVPIRPDDPGAYDNRVAIEKLKTLDLPALLAWADDDPITAPAEAHLRSLFRNVAPALVVKGAGHFIQEDAGEELAAHILKWMEHAGARAVQSRT
jgi:haloalkane dehalogenase